MAIHVFGIRHHGPGCARSLRAALDELQPDAVVIEGPADADEILPLAADDGFKPPVAMLLYPADDPGRAVYYPLTDFSPEWQALRWALAQNVPLRFMDLPQSHQMAIERPGPQEATAEPNAGEEADEPASETEEPPTNGGSPSPARLRTDPLALLAEAAGYTDHELWWEQQIERRMNAAGLFEAILQAMRTIRDAAEEIDERAGGLPIELHGDDSEMDKVLEALYDSDRSAGLGSSSPNVNRWLGDIRSYFPKSVVQVMQNDALHRLNLHQMLLEPETLEAIDADVHLIGTLLSLKNVIPNKTKATARQVVRKVVDELERKLRNPMTEAVRGALNKAARTSRPRAGEIDWHRTIRKNLHNYQPDRKTIIADRLVGYGRKRSSLRDIVLCIDQSGSMATSIVYSSIFGAVLASLRAVSTRLVVFDTEVVDLTEHLSDPVDVLFGTQLGGGTDINRAVGYCRKQITRPSQTIFVLISDLIEGGVQQQLLQRTAEIIGSGVTMICLLALSDEGSPCYDESLAAQMTALGAPAFACTPDLFPELMAAAIQKRDIAAWAARQDIIVRA